MKTQRTALEILNDMPERDRHEVLKTLDILSDPITRKILAYLAADVK